MSTLALNFCPLICIITTIAQLTLLLLLLLFLLSATSMACGSSWARDQNCTTAVTGAATETMPDP